MSTKDSSRGSSAAHPRTAAAALEKAAASRRERAEVKNRLKHSGLTLAEVIAEGKTNDVIGKMRVSALLESHARRRQGAGPPDHGGGRHLREPPRARARARTRWPRCSTVSGGRDAEPLPPHRPRRTDRRRQGHRRGLRPRSTTPRSGSRSRRPPARPRPGEVDGVHYHFVSDAEFDADGRAPASCSSGPSCTAGPSTAPRGGPVEEALAAGPARRCWRSTCRARARCARPCPRRCSSSSRRPTLGRAGPPAGRPRHRGRGGARGPAGHRAGRAGRRGGVRRDLVNDDVRRAAEELVSLMRTHPITRSDSETDACPEPRPIPSASPTRRSTTCSSVPTPSTRWSSTRPSGPGRSTPTTPSSGGPARVRRPAGRHPGAREAAVHRAARDQRGPADLHSHRGADRRDSASSSGSPGASRPTRPARSCGCSPRPATT